MSTNNTFLKAEETVRKIREIRPRWVKYSEDSECDKNGIGFNEDKRFSSVAFELSLDSWVGYYGRSGCSCFACIGDRDIFIKAFTEELNARLWELLESTAKRIEVSATKARAEYIAQLEAELARIRVAENTTAP